MKKFFILYFIIAICNANSEEFITIYNNGFANIKQKGELELKKGINYFFKEIINESSNFNSFILNINAKIIERTIEPSNFNNYDFLLKSKNKNVILQNDDLIIEGKVIDIKNDMLLLKTKNEQYITINNYNEFLITFNEIPEELKKYNRLIFKIESDKDKKEKYELSYIVNSLNWNTNYVAQYDEEKSLLNLQGFFNISNLSEEEYINANIRFIAGDVNNMEGNIYGSGRYTAAMSLKEERDVYNYIEPEQLNSVYVFNYPGKINIKANENKSLLFMQAANLKVINKKIYYTSSYNNESNFSNILEFDNKKTNNLGVQLPKGLVNVYQKNGEFNDFVGSSSIKNTPIDEKIQLNISKDFDLIGKTTVINNFRINDRQTETELEIEIRNRKNKNQDIEILANLGGRFEIINCSEKYEKIDNNFIKITLNAQKNSEKKINLKFRNTF